MCSDGSGDSDPAGGDAATAQAASPQQAAPAPAQQVAKAAKAKQPMKSVYDQQGRLIGLVDPDVFEAVLTTMPGATQGSAQAPAQGAAPPPAAGPAPAAAVEAAVQKAVAQAEWQLTRASRPHVYARDVASRTAACVCRSAMRAPIHAELAPGMPNPAARR